MLSSLSHPINATFGLNDRCLCSSNSNLPISPLQCLSFSICHSIKIIYFSFFDRVTIANTHTMGIKPTFTLIFKNHLFRFFLTFWVIISISTKLTDDLFSLLRPLKHTLKTSSPVIKVPISLFHSRHLDGRHAKTIHGTATYYSYEEAYSSSSKFKIVTT